MATKALRLELTGASSTFSFDVEGEFLPSRRAVFMEASNPPRLVEVRDVWDFRGCRLRSSDGTTETLWTAFKAMLSATEGALSARLVSAGNVELWKLGGTDQEQFRVEEISGRSDEAVRSASWATVAVVDLRLSAVTRRVEGSGPLVGVVGWDQRVSVSYPGGLLVLEWRTRITTREDTDARDLAKSLASIPAAGLSNFVWETNGPDGIEYVYTDANETTGRKPTVVEAVSRVRQVGVSVGSGGPGLGPSDVFLETVTTTTGDSDETTTRARATGPGASSWVAAQAPATFNRKTLATGFGDNSASGEWTTIRQRSGRLLNGSTVVIAAQVSGGRKSVSWEAVSGGRLPLKFKGSVQPWRAVVTLTLERRGSNLAVKDMPFPGALPEAWEIDADASTEGEPELVELSVDQSRDLYRREARIVARCASRPTSPDLVPAIKAGPPILSFLADLGPPAGGA